MRRTLFAVLALAGLSACKDPVGPDPIDPIDTIPTPTVPTLSIASTPSGAVAHPTSMAPVRFVFSATVQHGDANAVVWTRDGVAAGNGRTLSLDLLAGERARICGRLGSLEECFEKSVTRADLPIHLFTARPGLERPILGVTACVSAELRSTECQPVPVIGEFSVRPSWFDQVSSFKLCFEGESIEKLCFEVAGERLLHS